MPSGERLGAERECLNCGARVFKQRSSCCCTGCFVFPIACVSYIAFLAFVLQAPEAWVYALVIPIAAVACILAWRGISWRREHAACPRCGQRDWSNVRWRDVNEAEKILEERSATFRRMSYAELDDLLKYDLVEEIDGSSHTRYQFSADKSVEDIHWLEGDPNGLEIELRVCERDDAGKWGVLASESFIVVEQHETDYSDSPEA